MAKEADRLPPIWWVSFLLSVVFLCTGNAKSSGGLMLLSGIVQIAWPYTVGQMRAKRGHSTYNKIFCCALVGSVLGAIIIFIPPNNAMLITFMEAFVVVSMMGANLLFCIRLAKIATGGHTISNSFLGVFLAAFYWPLWPDWIRSRLG
ncbi:MAG: hypothetical protein AAF950_11730 [Pseudomonadota bacterium]